MSFPFGTRRCIYAESTSLDMLDVYLTLLVDVVCPVGNNKQTKTQASQKTHDVESMLD